MNTTSVIITSEAQSLARSRPSAEQPPQSTLPKPPDIEPHHFRGRHLHANISYYRFEAIGTTFICHILSDDNLASRWWLGFAGGETHFMHTDASSRWRMPDLSCLSTDKAAPDPRANEPLPELS